MEQKLIARDRECSMLRDCMESDRSEFVIVYGRRRVGKTFLIDQYFKMNYDFSFVGSHRFHYYFVPAKKHFFGESAKQKPFFLHF